MNFVYVDKAREMALQYKIKKASHRTFTFIRTLFLCDACGGVGKQKLSDIDADTASKFRKLIDAINQVAATWKAEPLGQSVLIR
jgi:excinuclease UvrABC ATPase subunit